MTDSPLDSKPDHEALKVLRDARALSPAAFWQAIRAINEPQECARWATRLCLLIGCTLILAAVVYFFAFNWDALGRWLKLGLLQVATLISLLTGQIVGFRKIGGQLLLMAAAVLVGVSFAVYDQVYQTGADAFSFFGMWALCILPWVIAGAFAPLWVLWFTLINLSAWFFWNQVGQFHLNLHYSYFCAALTVINAAGLFSREALATRYRWMNGRWLRHLFLLATLTPLFTPALNLIFESPTSGAYHLLGSTIAWLICLGAAYLYFTRQRFDSTALCILLGYATIYLITAIARMFYEADLYNNGSGFLVMALIIGGVTALDVRLLRWLKRRHGPRLGGDPA
ncbi:DUF2157 domain-containing protein [Coraliomargarita sp. W4R53]